MGVGRGGSRKNNDDILQDDGKLVLRGGRGNDTYIVDTKGVRIVEKNNGGHDHIVASIDQSLDAEVEDLTLTGDADLSGTGNDGNNTITGNGGDNHLAGGAGEDTLYGGDGYDTAVFTGSSTDYEITHDGEIIWITDADGLTDTLHDIEALSFDDLTLDIQEQVPEPDLEPVPNPDPEPVQPSATDDSASGNEDNSIVLHVLDNDTGTQLAVIAVSDGQMGRAVIGSDNTITYTPHPNAFGTDSIAYTIVDAHGQTSTASVQLDVLPVNDAPVAHADHVDAADGNVVYDQESVLDNDTDADGDALSVVAFDALSENGATVTMNTDGTFTYAAAPGFSGTDRFSYRVQDVHGTEAQAWVELHVTSDTPEVMPMPDGAPPADPARYVDALLAGEWFRLNSGESYGTGATVTVAFATETPEYYDADSNFTRDFTAFSEAQKANTLAILEQVSSFSGLTFVETSVDEAEMVFGFADIGNKGFAYFPTFDGVGRTASDVWLDVGLSGSDLDAGSDAHKTLIHEIGHALGLRHPELSEDVDNRAFSVMSDGFHPGMDGAEPDSFMSFDIAALQHLYGASDTHAAGDDVYDLAALEGRIQTMWDGGGNDTIDLSQSTYAIEIDLREGAQSSIAPDGSDNLAIAYGTEIENAIGGSGNDVLVGNDLNNSLAGGSGEDVFGFAEGWGSDRIMDFESGSDRIDLSRTGITFEDLFITTVDEGLLIYIGDDEILLADEDEIDPASFIFF